MGDILMSYLDSTGAIEKQFGLYVLSSILFWGYCGLNRKGHLMELFVKGLLWLVSMMIFLANMVGFLNNSIHFLMIIIIILYATLAILSAKILCISFDEHYVGKDC